MPRKRKEPAAVSETNEAPVAAAEWQPAPGADQAQAEADALVGKAVTDGDGVTVTIVAEPKPQPREKGRDVETVFPGIRRVDF